MRDPQAFLEFHLTKVTRLLRVPIEQDHPLLSSSVSELVTDGLLIPFEYNGEQTFVSPKVPFVSSPYEWCDEQLFDASELTLRLLDRVNELGADLKDASAWNVVFEGCKPIFCDLTSIEPLKSKQWWAAGQFVRHFISPLWLALTTGMKSSDAFLISRDGIQPDFVRQTLGLRRFFYRCWPLVADSSIASRGRPVLSSDSRTPAYRKQLVESLRWMVHGVRPRVARKSVWGHYTSEREHYPPDALSLKQQTIDGWLSRLAPKWTVDLGCNSGEFSKMALNAGSSVIAVDGDHDAIQSLYRLNKGDTRIYPVLAILDDLCAGRGWMGQEHKAFLDRIPKNVDMLLMLALIHHLSIASAIPLNMIAQFAASLTSRWLVVEWLQPYDPQVLLLCKQRMRDPDEFSVDKQRTCFLSAGFTLLEELVLPSGNRRLALLEKHS